MLFTLIFNKKLKLSFYLKALKFEFAGFVSANKF